MNEKSYIIAAAARATHPFRFQIQAETKGSRKFGFEKRNGKVSVFDLGSGNG